MRRFSAGVRASHAPRTLASTLTDDRAMDGLRAKISGYLMLLIGLILVGTALTLPGPLSGRKAAVLLVVMPIPVLAAAVVRAGSRLSDLMFVLSQCLVEMLLLPLALLTHEPGASPPANGGLIIPVLICAVFARRRRLVALQVGVTIASASLTSLLILDVGDACKAAIGDAFTFIAAAVVVRLLRELAEEGVRQAEAALERAEEATRRAELGEITDPLTGLPNRRGFERLGGGEWHRRAQENLPLAVLLIDIDHFKQVNDTRGHSAGDELLRSVAERLNLLLRDRDVAYRLGGEEFAVLAHCSPGEAPLVAERVRCLIEQELPITVSIGVFEAAPDESPDSVAALWRAVDRADTGLYTAKRNGRNRVELVSSPAI